MECRYDSPTLAGPLFGPLRECDRPRFLHMRRAHERSTQLHPCAEDPICLPRLKAPRGGVQVCVTPALRAGRERKLGDEGASREKLEGILRRPKFSQSFLKLNGPGLAGTSRLWPGPQDPESRMVS